MTAAKPLPTQCPFDHAVITVRDRMDEGEAIYRRMGFTLTARSFHPAGSCNHLMVFAGDYLELIGFPPAGGKIRPDLLESPIGLDGLVFKAGDVDAIHGTLVGLGLPAGEPQLLTRKLTLPGAAHEEEARFTAVRLPRGALQGGRLYYCRHETPHLVWHPPFMVHANGAVGIASFTIAVPDPAAEAGRYAKILDRQATLLPDGSARVGMGRADLELLTPALLRTRLGALACDPADADGKPRDAYMAMVTVRVRDLGVARTVLQQGGFGLREIGGALVVPAGEAMNCTLGFVQ